MFDYFERASDQLFEATLEHFLLSIEALGISLIIASLLTVFLLRFPKWRTFSVYTLSLIYAIPSFALFSILIPLTGLGRVTAICVLVVYAQYVLVRTFLTGLDKVDAGIVEAAQGMGMNFWQILFKVQIPLAKASLFSAIRLASISIVAIATIAATINAGGLGTILFEGLRTLSLVKLSWGILLTVGLSLLFNFLLYLIESVVE